MDNVVGQFNGFNIDRLTNKERQTFRQINENVERLEGLAEGQNIAGHKDKSVRLSRQSS